MDDPRITMEGWGDTEIGQGTNFTPSEVVNNSELVRENKGGGGGGGSGGGGGGGDIVKTLQIE